MTFPAVVGTGSWTANGNSLATHRANIPAGVQAGDLVLVLWSRAANGGLGTLVTPPWTDLFAQTGAVPPAIGSRLAYQIATGAMAAGDVDLVTLSADRGTSQTLVIRGFTGLPVCRNPFDMQNNTATPQAGQLVSGFGAVDTLWLACLFGEYGDAVVTGYPAGYSNGFTGGPGGAASCVASAQRLLTAASEDPANFTLSQVDNSYCTVVAVQGVAAAARARAQAIVI